jgi:putative transposase
MAQSFAVVPVHLVFSTKQRYPFLMDDGLRKEMFSFLGDTSNRLGCEVKQVGGMPDHIHILALLARSISLANWVKELKRSSSIWIKQREPALADFAWQVGYGAFAVSQDRIERAQRYIRHQERHHRAQTFQDEFRSFLLYHETTWDERYVWD